MQETLELKRKLFSENGLHGFSMMYMLHFIHIRYDYKREQKRRVITD